METIYGTFPLTRTILSESKIFKCQYDEDENRKAKFVCSKVDGRLQFVPTYTCIQTSKTADIENLAKMVILNTMFLP